MNTLSFFGPTAIALALASGCRRTSSVEPNHQDAAPPIADAVPERISGRGIPFSSILPARLPEFCPTAVRSNLNLCLFRVGDPLVPPPAEPVLTNVYAFRNPSDFETFQTGSIEDLRRLLGNLLTRDIGVAFASENGRAAAALLRREGNRFATRSQCEAAISFLSDLTRILSAARAAEEDGFAPGTLTNAAALEAICRYSEAVDRNPAAVLADLEAMRDGRDAQAFLEWLSRLSDLHPLPGFEEHLRRLSSGHPNPRTVAIIAAGDYWNLLLADDSQIPAVLWNRETSAEFSRLNTDGSLDFRFLTVLRFLLPGRGYSYDHVSRILSSHHPIEALSPRSPDLAALVREIARRDSESIPIGCLNCLPGGGTIMRIRRVGPIFR